MAQPQRGARRNEDASVEGGGSPAGARAHQRRASRRLHVVAVLVGSSAQLGALPASSPAPTTHPFFSFPLPFGRRPVDRTHDAGAVVPIAVGSHGSRSKGRWGVVFRLVTDTSFLWGPTPGKGFLANSPLLMGARRAFVVDRSTVAVNAYPLGGRARRADRNDQATPQHTQAAHRRPPVGTRTRCSRGWLCGRDGGGRRGLFPAAARWMHTSSFYLLIDRSADGTDQGACSSPRRRARTRWAHFRRPSRRVALALV